ncbi:MAG: bifunctional riboflavin kinase/FAD synthetase [Methylococcaceae bacterium]|nr:MAG: bifunctional riboflavin kinase/FAD synthetase [Methylococcaceae bacterium]
MRIFRGIRRSPHPHGCVLTIGTFDGVHLGHQTLIRKLAEQGRHLGLPVTIALFEPQPREYFQPELAPARLYRLREKVQALAALPVDSTLVLRFNRSLADLPPEEFIQRILVEGLNVKYLVVGDDFRFGRGRSGDFALLRRAGEQVGFTVTDTPTYTLEQRRISSTWVREALQAGDCAKAARLLGRPYAVSGRVIHGNQRGRLLGFPTANLALRRTNAPLSGVFAVTLHGIDGQALAGVANVGVRPTLTGDTTVLLETHVFDFQRDIYQRLVEVRFHAKLRDEQRFASVEELRAQIQTDAEAARRFFAGSSILARQ